MKKLFFLFLLVIIFIIWTHSQEEGKKTFLISPEIIAPVIGFYYISFEFAVGDNISIYIMPMMFIARLSLVYLSNPEIFPKWFVGGNIGAHYWTSGKVLEGFFIGLSGGVFYHYVGDIDNNENIFIKAGIDIGIRQYIDWFSIAPQIFLGYRHCFPSTSEFGMDFNQNGFDFGIGFGTGIVF